VAQIVVLDALFSLDFVITAIGMVDEAYAMAAVVVAVLVMLLASKPLTRFVNAHPPLVDLCLSFLLMIGLVLIAAGFGYHVPKGYLYAAIGFPVLIETSIRSHCAIDANGPRYCRRGSALPTRRCGSSAACR